MPRKQTPFVIRHDTLYVRVDHVMAPLTAMTDGIEMGVFKSEKHLYMKVTDAILWCKKERTFHSNKDEYNRAIRILERAIREVRDHPERSII